jgi:hypothetical protein
MAENQSDERPWFQDWAPWLVIVSLLAVPGIWLAARVRPQWAAVRAIRAAGGSVDYEEATPSILRPAWLRRLLPQDFFDTATSVGLPSGRCADAGSAHLKALPRLESLGFVDVSDANLECLGDVPQLQRLHLLGSHITDVGLQHLEGLGNLQDLDLGNTKITDAGLQHLEGLKRLQRLKLDGTGIGDAGLEHLSGLTDLTYLRLDGTKTGDTGLESLKGMRRLEWLNLCNTRVSDASLKHLKRLTELKDIYLHGTQVTEAGVEDLLKALPDASIGWGMIIGAHDKP